MTAAEKSNLISQYIHMPNNNVVHPKFIQCYFLLYLKETVRKVFKKEEEGKGEEERRGQQQLVKIKIQQFC